MPPVQTTVPRPPAQTNDKRKATSSPVSFGQYLSDGPGTVLADGRMQPCLVVSSNGNGETCLCPEVVCERVLLLLRSEFLREAVPESPLFEKADHMSWDFLVWRDMSRGDMLCMRNLDAMGGGEAQQLAELISEFITGKPGELIGLRVEGGWLKLGSANRRRENLTPDSADSIMETLRALILDNPGMDSGELFRAVRELHETTPLSQPRFRSLLNQVCKDDPGLRTLRADARKERALAVIAGTGAKPACSGTKVSIGELSAAVVGILTPHPLTIGEVAAQLRKIYPDARLTERVIQHVANRACKGHSGLKLLAVDATTAPGRKDAENLQPPRLITDVRETIFQIMRSDIAISTGELARRLALRHLDNAPAESILRDLLIPDVFRKYPWLENARIRRLEEVAVQDKPEAAAPQEARKPRKTTRTEQAYEALKADPSLSDGELAEKIGARHDYVRYTIIPEVFFRHPEIKDAVVRARFARAAREEEAAEAAAAQAADANAPKPGAKPAVPATGVKRKVTGSVNPPAEASGETSRPGESPTFDESEAAKKAKEMGPITYTAYVALKTMHDVTDAELAEKLREAHPGDKLTDRDVRLFILRARSYIK